MNLVITEKDNKVVGLVIKNEIPINGISVSQEQKNLFEEKLKKQYEAYGGLSFEFTYDESVIIIEMIVDLDKSDELPSEISGITKNLKNTSVKDFIG